MTEFAGFDMPVRYGSQVEEHKAVRERAGLFDVSHMGEFFVSGEGAEQYLQKITTNDVSKLSDGQAQYSCMTKENGGIIDDLIVYRLNDLEYMMVVNAGNIQKNWDWCLEHKPDNVTLENKSDAMALIALQGPLAKDVLKKLTETAIESIKFYHFATGTVAGINDVIISGTGYTGSGGFELYCKSEDAVSLWTALTEAGSEFNLAPCGLGARETLRLEMGYCLYGNDIDETTNPIEARLGWVTKINTKFIGSEEIAKEKEEGPKKKLIAFRLNKKGVPRKDYQIVNGESETIGKVTSGSFGPTVQQPIGLGYVETAYSKTGTEIFIQIRNKPYSATIVKLPFYQPTP